MAGLLGACMGSIEDGAAGPPGGGDNRDHMGAGGTAAGPAGTGGGWVLPPDAIITPVGKGLPGKVCGTYPKAAAGPGPSPIRRLTRAEYDNTVFDLLNDSSNPSAGLQADTRPARGFDNFAGTQAVTVQLAEDYFGAAGSLAARAVTNPMVVPACTAGGEEACARTFVTGFGQRAFRRPLGAADIASLMGLYTAARARGDEHTLAMRHVLTSILQSPYFLYRVEMGDPATGKGLSSWEMASRLSYLLWGTMPDPDLFTAVEANALKTPEQVKLQVDRMLASPKTHRMAARFHEQLLDLQKLDTLTKDAKMFPDFAAVRANMKEETTRFMERAFWSGDGSAPGLFTAATSFLTPELDKFINKRTASTLKAGFQSATLDATQRVGLLTQASLLAITAKQGETLPVKRGRFVLEQFLCAEVPDPPANAQNMAPARVPGSSTREWFEAIDSSASGCATCHKMMDPVGFTFENFDAAGRWRTTDGGKAVNASGSIGGAVIGADQDAEVVGAVALSKVIADSSEMKKCMAKQWLRFALGRPEVAQDEKSMDQLFCSFENGNFNMRDLLAGVTQTESFLGRAGGAP